MLATNCLEYYNQKKSLLNQLLSLSETLIDDAYDFDLFVITLEKREVLIQKLVQFENQSKAVFTPLLSSVQVEELNRLVSLVTSLGEHAAALLSEEQNKLIETIRNNIQEQKLFKYSGDASIQSGNLIDYKK